MSCLNGVTLEDALFLPPPVLPHVPVHLALDEPRLFRELPSPPPRAAPPRSGRAGGRRRGYRPLSHSHPAHSPAPRAGALGPAPAPPAPCAPAGSPRPLPGSHRAVDLAGVRVPGGQRARDGRRSCAQLGEPRGKEGKQNDFEDQHIVTFSD